MLTEKLHQKKMDTLEEKIKLQEMINEEEELKQKRIELKKKYKRKSMQTTKKYMLFTHALCLLVVLFSMYEMDKCQNLDALSTLIGACVADVLANGFYMCKSYVETKNEENLKFEREKLNTVDDSDTEQYDIDTDCSGESDDNETNIEDV